MSLLSRALWTSTFEGQEPQEVALHLLRDWIWETDEAHEDDGTYTRTILRTLDDVPVEGTRTVALRRHTQPPGLRIQIDDQLDDTTWGVSILVAVQDGQVLCCVDNTVETSNSNLRIAAGRPRAVDALLNLGKDPRVGATAIQTVPMEVDGRTVPALVEHLVNEDRVLPLIVVTCSRQGFSEGVKQAARQLAKRLTGLAVVALVDQGAQDGLKAALPDRLGVWGGAVRVYAPGPLTTSDAWRHRFFTADRFPRSLDQVVSWVIGITARRRLPDVLREMERSTIDISDLTALWAKVESLRSELETSEFELAIEQDERARLDQQLNQVLGHNSRMRAVGFELGRGDEVFTLEHPSADEAPDDAQSVGDAFVQAQLFLTNELSIPDSAACQHDRLDAAPNAAAWGNSTWRGLIALAEYARAKKESRFSGSFWNWCEQGASTWPATPKKLAMSESETTASNRKYRSARVFAVDSALDSSGERYMEAHLKISEGGGNLAPRVYFFDDTDGVTHKVHIGFVGPHDLVPNSKA